MSNIKKYIIDYDWKASIEIEIDHDVMTEEKLHQINNFWSDSEYRLNKHGSVLNAVLIMLAQHALLIAISSDLIRDSFDKVAKRVPAFKGILNEWDSLVALLKSEMKAYGNKAPETYRRISELRKD